MREKGGAVALFELVITLLLVGAVLAAWARRLHIPYPALLALAGAALALVPNTPTVTLDPQLALTLFVAPVLLDAAFDASPRDLRHQWRPVASLALLAVAITVAAVAVVARRIVPDLPWPAAIALGAIVAPPDAAAATAVLRQLRPPHRLLVILGGESLFNDASALLIYRLAVGAATTGAIAGWQVVPLLLAVTLGSALLGIVLARVFLLATLRIRDVATAVILQFIGTFAVWVIAERLHLSGIVTMVVYAISVARVAPDLTPASVRIPSYAVWEVAVFVLNVLAFILVGLQLKPILGRLNRTEWITYAQMAAAVCATVVLVRIVWVVGTVSLRRWIDRWRGATGGTRETWRGALVIAWCGMRGTVTLAAALALPDGGSAAAFPYRDLILFTAFWVVLGTLVLQGMTLPLLLSRLRLRDDGTVEREVQLARAETARAALDALDGGAGASGDAAILRRAYEARLAHAESALQHGGPEAPGGAPPVAHALQAAVDAERRVLSELRTDGTIGDDAFHRIEEEIDRAELGAESRLLPG
jgi:CPA1 family monovalent cation:H+ antiporter